MIVGKTWKAKIYPNESVFVIRSPNKKDAPAFVNARMPTNTLDIELNPIFINGTLRTPKAKTSWIIKPENTIRQLIDFLNELNI